MSTFIKIATVCLLTAVASPLFAQVHLEVNFAPPAPRHEIVVTAPSADVVWMPGYYQYNALNARYVWVPGHYATPPAGQTTWVRPRYVKHGNHYDFVAGQWTANPGKHKGWTNGKHKGWYKAHGKKER